MSLGKKCVLVVDDEPSILEMYREIFDSKLIELVCCEDGIAALQQAKNRHFDLIITDINMPQLDGKLLISCVRFDSMSKNSPIIVVSSEVSHGLIEKMASLNIAKPFKKPFQIREFKSAVDEILFKKHRRIEGLTDSFQELLCNDTFQLLEFYLHDQVQLSKAVPVTDKRSVGCQTSYINLWGKLIYGGLWLSFQEDFLKVVAVQMFGDDYVSTMGMDGIKDITNEFLNQIAGNLRTNLLSDGVVSAIGVPYLIEGKGALLPRCVTSPVFGFDLSHRNKRVGRLDISLGDPQLIGENLEAIADRYFVFEQEKSSPMRNSA